MENERIREKEYYREKIVEMVEKAERQDVLEYLYSFIKSFLEKYKWLLK